MGMAGQPDFVNAVAKISTDLYPMELLAILQEIEQQHQRVRTAQRWGPRTLDLDILLYGDLQMHTKELQIPHPGISEREFVLIPLQEMEEDLMIPGKGSLRELIDKLPEYQLTRIATPGCRSNDLKYIVIEGSIGVGKTSLAQRLGDEFGSYLLLEQADENPFLEQFYQNPREAAPVNATVFPVAADQAVAGIQAGRYLFSGPGIPIS